MMSATASAVTGLPRNSSEMMETGLQHDHHDLTVAAMHSHLDHDNCLESVILKGATAEVRQFADVLMAESGVRHGKLNLIAPEPENHHAHDEHGTAHVHYRPAR